MIGFDASRLFPRFLMEDRNGFALAMAISRALEMMGDAVQAGLAIVKDVESMPEWRLDEMAWELDCLYDAGADVESKRRWIRDAMPLQAALGTPQAIYGYLEGMFERVALEEAWQYGGEAHHFRVTLEGDWTTQNARFVKMAVEQAKNVRSVPDGVCLSRRCTAFVDASATSARFFYPMAAEPQMGGVSCGEDII